MFAAGEDSDVEDLLATTGSYLAAPTSMPSHTINIKACTDLNKEAYMRVITQHMNLHVRQKLAPHMNLHVRQRVTQHMNLHVRH